MRNILISFLIVQFLFMPLANATHYACARDLEKLVNEKFTQELLDNLSNADLFPVRYVLNKVTNDPKVILSSQDKAIISKYHLEHGVEFARKEGLERLKRQAKVDRTNLMNKLTLQGGGAGLLFLTLYGQFIEKEATEEGLNEAFGLKLKNNHIDDVQFFSDVLHCNPNLSKTIERVDMFKERNEVGKYDDETEKTIYTQPDYTVVDLLRGDEKLYGKVESIISIYTQSFIRGNDMMEEIDKKISNLQYGVKNIADYLPGVHKANNAQMNNYVLRRSELYKIKDLSDNQRRVLKGINDKITKLEKKLKDSKTETNLKWKIEEQIRSLKNKKRVVGELNDNTLAYLQLKYIWRNAGVSICSDRLSQIEFHINKETINFIYQLIARLPQRHQELIKENLESIYIVDSSQGDLPFFVDGNKRFFSNYRSRMKKIDLFLPGNVGGEDSHSIEKYLTRSIVEVLTENLGKKDYQGWTKVSDRDFREVSECYFDQTCRENLASEHVEEFQFLDNVFELEKEKTDDEMMDLVRVDYRELLKKHLDNRMNKVYVTEKMKDRGGQVEETK